MYRFTTKIIDNHKLLPPIICFNLSLLVYMQNANPNPSPMAPPLAHFCKPARKEKQN